MASPQSVTSSEPARVEQVITEFFAKSLHIILEARSPCVSSRNYYSGDCSTSSTPSSSPTSSIRPRDKWFNLALRECPAAVENLDWWRQSNLELLVVDVVLVRRQSDTEVTRTKPGGCLLRNLSVKELYPNSLSPRQDGLASKSNNKKIIERWIIQYERQNCSATNSDSDTKKSGGRSSCSPEMSTAYKKTYRRSIILMRSLYTTVRLLPSYKVFRDLKSNGQITPFSLTHKISSFVDPFSRKEDAERNHFSFVPVDTPCGRLCLSVSYLPLLADDISEPSTPMSPQFITDYVGSPLADPLKRIRSLPTSGPLPANIPFSRRHSWSNDRGVTPSVSPSPSPTYSDSRASQNLAVFAHIQFNTNISPKMLSHNTLQFQRNYNASDDCWSSPPVSPSSLPSPTAKFPFRKLSCALPRTESSPIKIPVPGNGTGFYDHLPPTPSPKSRRKSDSYQTGTSRDKVSDISSPGSVFRNKQESRGSQTRTAAPKVIALNDDPKDDLGHFPGIKMLSCPSPCIPSLRSNNQHSTLDDYDDSEFTWAFAAEYDDIRTDLSSERQRSSESSESSKPLQVQISQDAAIGALVQMLKKAPPLYQDFSNPVSTSRDSVGGNRKDEAKPKGSKRAVCSVSTSRLHRSRTAGDAIEQLRSYTEMKDILRRQGEPNSSAAIPDGVSTDGNDPDVK